MITYVSIIRLQYNIPGLRMTTDALQSSVKLPVAVQLRVNVELVRLTSGPVDTTTPSLSVHW